VNGAERIFSQRPRARQTSSISGSQKAKLQSDLVTLYRLWAETDCRLDVLAKQVREGLAVDEASNFARWLQFSGVMEILKAADFSNTQLRADVPGLKLKFEKLISDCGEWYAQHERSRTPRDAYISASKLSALESEMRLMREQISRLLPQTETVPALQIIQGGNSI